MMETNIDTDDGEIHAYKENVIERQHGTIRLGAALKKRRLNGLATLYGGVKTGRNWHVRQHQKIPYIL